MKNNFSGLWGFIFACLAAVFFWLPYAGGIFWVLGALLSTIGLANRPNTLAWAGFIISFFWIILYIIFGILLGSFFAFTLYPYYMW